MTTTPRIAIAGAGLGGLACARVLQLHGLDVTVFERETSPAARGQGGTLDLHADSGQIALCTAGLLERFRALARPEGQEMRLLDTATTGFLMHDVPAEGVEEKPEIDRGQLRDLLLDSLAPGTVHWGQPVRAVTPLAGGRARAEFEDGGAEEFDLVVGADGAWSRVRPAVSDAQPVYSGVVFVETGLDDADRRHPRQAGLVGAGMMMAKAPNRGIFAQRNSNSHLRVYAAIRCPADWHEAAGVDLDDPASVREYLLRLFDGWHDDLRALVADSDTGFVNRPLYVLPVPHTWAHVPGVTLLGDAAHLMPPLGQGANLALLDGTELATALAAEPTVDDAVRAYESVMLPRSIEAAKACESGLEILVGADGPEGTLRFFDELAEA